MRVTISARNVDSSPVADGHALSRALHALRPHLQAHANLTLVFDASLGDAIEVVRRGCAGWIEPRDTRVWGEPATRCEGNPASQDVDRLRYLRCVAELEPDVVVELELSAGRPGVPTGFPFMTTERSWSLDAAGARALVHSLNPRTLLAGRPSGRPSDMPAAHASEAGDRFWTRSARRWLIVTSGPGALSTSVARQIAEHPDVLDVAVRRADLLEVGDLANRAIAYVPEPGVGLDALLAAIAHDRGHVVASEETIRRLLPHLTLGMMLRVASEVFGYPGMRRALHAGGIDPLTLSTWLRQQSRGATLRAHPCEWMHWQAAIDEALSKSLAGHGRTGTPLQEGLADDVAKPGEQMQRLLVDVSALAKFDARSGIQRVVRNVLAHLQDALPPHVQATPIAFLDDGRCFHASTFHARFKGFPYDVPGDEPLQIQPGDVFLGLDLSAHILPSHLDKFHKFRRLGVPLHFVLYDMLPMSRPECFDPRVVDLFRAWYEAVADVADGVICISKAVADEFRGWMDERRPTRAAPVRIGYFHLGADILAPDDEGLVAHESAALAPLEGRRYALMVSTLEPRKGYKQAVAAFELLWAEGNDLSLVIVGKEGWLMKELADHLRAHPERGYRFHWFEGISDAMLTALYRDASLLLSASEGEGFGLSLIEAAQHGVPVLCRDLPVFREVAGAAAFYFRGYRKENLADALRAWAAGEMVLPTSAIAWKTWREATGELVDALLCPSSYAKWTPGNHRHVFSGYNPRLALVAGERCRGRIVAAGRAGFLMHGPYVAVAAGAYRLLVRGELPEGHAGGVHVDVVSSSGRHQIAADVPVLQQHDGVLIDYDFAIDTAVDDLEVRIVVSEESTIEVSQVEILAVEPQESDAHDISHMNERQESCE